MFKSLKFPTVMSPILLVKSTIRTSSKYSSKQVTQTTSDWSTFRPTELKMDLNGWKIEVGQNILKHKLLLYTLKNN